MTALCSTEVVQTSRQRWQRWGESTPVVQRKRPKGWRYGDGLETSLTSKCPTYVWKYPLLYIKKKDLLSILNNCKYS